MIERREFIGSLALGLLASPFVADAQPPRAYRVEGRPLWRLVPGSRRRAPEGLGELGLVGTQFILHVREGKGDVKAVEEAAVDDLERDKVDLIYAIATSVTLAAKRATKTVPIVFYAGSDPVAAGLVESYRKPGGRFTGTYGRLTDLTAKRLELLKEMVSRVRRVVIFYNPGNPVAEGA
jgi:putative ABC transport system substrate-binding protein